LLVSVFGAAAFGNDDVAPLVMGETFTIHSEILKESRRINVFLPRAYAESSELRLPVLCMPDGGMAEDFLHVAGLVQVLTGNGTMQPCLLVGIENTQRRRDLTGPTENEADKRIAPRVGESGAFRTFLRDELMPRVKGQYRTTGEAAIVGESLAGLFVIETFFLEPEMFDTYIAFDPSLWWNQRGLLNDAAQRLAERPKLKKVLYFASSSEEGIVKDSKRLAKILETNAPAGLRWHYEPTPEEGHATIFHPAALRAFRKVFTPIRRAGETIEGA
jgi:predicted alpha/beta superfamily hydrolase